MKGLLITALLFSLVIGQEVIPPKNLCGHFLKCLSKRAYGEGNVPSPIAPAASVGGGEGGDGNGNGGRGVGNGNGGRGGGGGGGGGGGRKRRQSGFPGQSGQSGFGFQYGMSGQPGFLGGGGGGGDGIPNQPIQPQQPPQFIPCYQCRFGERPQFITQDGLYLCGQCFQYQTALAQQSFNQHAVPMKEKGNSRFAREADFPDQTGITTESGFPDFN